MYTVVDVTSNVDLWFKKDPVRPELTPDFRQKSGRYVFALMDEQSSAKAFCCFAICNKVPRNVKELDKFTTSKEEGFLVAVPYSVWRYEKGGGYRILKNLIPIFKNRLQLINESLNEQATPYLRQWKLNNLKGFGSLLKYVDNTPLAQFIAGSEQIGQSFEAAKISLKQLGVNKIKQQIDEANASNGGLGIKDSQTVYVYPDGAIDFNRSNIKRPVFMTQAPSTPRQGRFDITGKLITERQGVFGEVPSEPMTFADYKKMQEAKKQEFSDGIKINLEEMKAFDDVLSLVEQPEFLDEDGATTMDVINTLFRMSPQLGIGIGGGLLTPATGGSSLVASTALIFGQEYGNNYWEALKTGLREEIKEKEGVEREPTNDEIVDALINNKYQGQGEAAGWAAVSSLLKQGTALRGAKSLKGLNDSILNFSKKLGYKDIKDMLIKTGKNNFNDMLRGGGQTLIKSGKGGISEFLTEGAQGLTNQAAVSQALNGTAIDRLDVKNTLEEGIAGGVVGAVLPGVGSMTKGGVSFIESLFSTDFFL